jgi:hypothetical protein
VPSPDYGDIRFAPRAASAAPAAEKACRLDYEAVAELDERLPL